jgi:hypothetical protein
MKLIVEVTMDNAAFDSSGFELARVLSAAQDRTIELLTGTRTEHFAPGTYAELRDTNGNLVGSVRLEGVLWCDECGNGWGVDECAFCDGKFCIGCSAPGDHQDCLEE